MKTYDVLVEQIRAAMKQAGQNQPLSADLRCRMFVSLLAGLINAEDPTLAAELWVFTLTIQSPGAACT